MAAIKPAYPAIDKRQFMEALEYQFSPFQMIKLRAAYAHSKIGHQDQRRDDGVRYFEHLKAVAWIIVDELGFVHYATVISALLHDIIEDTYLLTPESIEAFFGREVAINVRLLTKQQEPIEEYLARIRKSRRWRLVLVKLADRLHNLRSLDTCNERKRRHAISETEEHYLGLADYFVEICPRSRLSMAQSLRALLIEELNRLNPSRNASHPAV